MFWSVDIQPSGLQCNVHVLWIPSHIGLTANEKADQTTKSALNLLNISAYPLTYSDIMSLLKETPFPS